MVKNGEIDKKIEELYDILSSCKLCPNECKVNRIKGEVGFCKVKDKPIISSYGPHFGEESPLVAYGGSGTIFFTYCNLKCVYCQNWEISQLGEGYEITVENLGKIMLYLQEKGCHNINLVTPTHQIPFIVKAIKFAALNGLEIPIVYNSGGYESVEVLRILDGVVDIYLPDFKYFSNENALKYSKIKNYVNYAKDGFLEMFRQVGDLKINSEGIAYKGLLIRHLVLPNDLSDSKEVLRFISEKISKKCYVNVMAQYRPCWNAYNFTELNRKITKEEFNRVLNFAKKIGLNII